MLISDKTLDGNNIQKIYRISINKLYELELTKKEMKYKIVKIALCTVLVRYRYFLLLRANPIA